MDLPAPIVGRSLLTLAAIVVLMSLLMLISENFSVILCIALVVLRQVCRRHRHVFAGFELLITFMSFSVLELLLIVMLTYIFASCRRPILLVFVVVFMYFVVLRIIGPTLYRLLSSRFRRLAKRYRWARFRFDTSEDEQRHVDFLSQWILDMADVVHALQFGRWEASILDELQNCGLFLVEPQTYEEGRQMFMQHVRPFIYSSDWEL